MENSTNQWTWNNRHSSRNGFLFWISEGASDLGLDINPRISSLFQHFVGHSNRYCRERPTGSWYLLLALLHPIQLVLSDSGFAITLSAGCFFSATMDWIYLRNRNSRMLSVNNSQGRAPYLLYPAVPPANTLLDSRYISASQKRRCSVRNWQKLRIHYSTYQPLDRL